jgi:hypothetical protein
MEHFMNALQERCQFLNSRWCNLAIGFVVFLNPFAILPQLIVAITASSEKVKGVSVSTYVLFAAIQLAIIASSIKGKDWKLFISMFVSLFLTIAIVVTVLIRA